MALVSQEAGRSILGPLALNAMAPDEGNMHTLLLAGTPEQKQRWLEPLVRGEIRSCFAMTEPDVASSDPLNLRTTARREGSDWVLDGRKWAISGAIGATFAIVVARTGGARLGRRAYSLFLVPCDTPGWELVRDARWLGMHTAGGHPEIRLTAVRVPADHLLGEVGAGFQIAQQRLAGGRLAHAMRWIGVAQRALDMAAARASQRSAFGRPLSDHGVIQAFLADSAMDLYAARMMVLHTAWRLEAGLPHRQEVAMAKTFASEAFGRVMDRAVQIFGSHGVAMDLPIAQWYADARTSRIYDGASEVHRMVIGRELVRAVAAGRSSGPLCGALE